MFAWYETNSGFSTHINKELATIIFNSLCCIINLEQIYLCSSTAAKLPYDVFSYNNGHVHCHDQFLHNNLQSTKISLNQCQQENTHSPHVEGIVNQYTIREHYSETVNPFLLHLSAFSCISYISWVTLWISLFWELYSVHRIN